MDARCTPKSARDTGFDLYGAWKCSREQVVTAAMARRTLRTELHNLEGSEAGFASLFRGVREREREGEREFGSRP